MKVTLYGLFAGIAIFIGTSFINILKIKDIILIMLIIFFSILSNLFLCTSCYETYSLASYITTIPLLFMVFLNCYKLKEAIFIFAIMCAIGRIGCYFAGCCSGKVTSKKPYTIDYKENSFLYSKKNNTKIIQKNISVYPTIFIEICFQFFIAYLVYYNSYGIIYYGILNALLLYLTCYWREYSRMDSLTILPILSLLLFSLFSYKKKCYNINYKQKFVLNFNSIPFAILLTLILSNDINHKTFY